MKKTLLAAAGLGVALLLAAAVIPQSVIAQEVVTPYVSVLKGEQHFLTGYDPINRDGTYNVVIEIPAGTTAKYETNKKTGMLELEQKNGAPRFVQYLGYPVNYGAIPRSVLLKSKGGDDDSVDVLVLGQAVPRGAVVKGRVIGLLSLIDTGEKDDKAVVVMENSPFAKVTSIADLDAKFPGVTTILQTWFTSYKGYGKDGKLMLSSTGFKGRVDAIKLIGDAILDYENSVVTEADKRPLDEKGNPYLYRWPGAKNVGE
ncbi:MAG: inorganic diphosphatase [Deltaproteobacteria bacterium]|nr:inorganic diphosphatase [Deltaproteobacteria bacterium]